MSHYFREVLFISAPPLILSCLVIVFGLGFLDVTLLELCGSIGSEVVLQVLQVIFGVLTAACATSAALSSTRITDALKWHAASTRTIKLIELSRTNVTWNAAIVAARAGGMAIIAVIAVLVASLAMNPVGHLLYAQKVAVVPSTIKRFSTEDVEPIGNLNRMWGGSGAGVVNGNPRALASVWEGVAQANVSTLNEFAETINLDGLRYVLPFGDKHGRQPNRATYNVAFGSKYECVNRTGLPNDTVLSSFFKPDKVPLIANLYFHRYKTARVGFNRWETNVAIWSNNTISPVSSNGRGTKWADCQLTVQALSISAVDCKSARIASCSLSNAPVNGIIMLSVGYSTSNNETVYGLYDHAGYGPKYFKATEFVDYGLGVSGNEFEGPILLSQKLESLAFVSRYDSEAIYKESRYTEATASWLAGGVVQNASDWQDEDILLARAKSMLFRRWNAALSNVNFVQSANPDNVVIYGGPPIICYSSSRIPAFAFAGAMVLIAVVDLAALWISRGVRATPLRLLAAGTTGALRRHLELHVAVPDVELASHASNVNVSVFSDRSGVAAFEITRYGKVGLRDEITQLRGSN